MRRERYEAPHSRSPAQSRRGRSGPGASRARPGYRASPAAAAEQAQPRVAGPARPPPCARLRPPSPRRGPALRPPARSHHLAPRRPPAAPLPPSDRRPRGAPPPFCAEPPHSQLVPAPFLPVLYPLGREHGRHLPCVAPRSPDAGATGAGQRGRCGPRGTTGRPRRALGDGAAQGRNGACSATPRPEVRCRGRGPLTALWRMRCSSCRPSC